MTHDQIRLYIPLPGALGGVFEYNIYWFNIWWVIDWKKEEAKTLSNSLLKKNTQFFYLTSMIIN
jgi:hypothetical protein